MISFEDCFALCGLTKEEIAAIAEHEHIPDMAAAILGQYILEREHKPEEICRMIQDDVRAAAAAGDWAHAGRLLAALRHFLATHPACPDTKAGSSP